MGPTGRFVRRFSPVSLVAAVVLLVSPSGVSAATQIGQTFTPLSGNPSGNTWLPSGAPQYFVPSAGVITSWSFEADGSPPQIKFKVGRPAPGADFTVNADFTIIGESALVTPETNRLNSYPIQIPVQVGDMIGIYGATAGDWGRLVADFTYHVGSGDVPVGIPETFDLSGDFQFDLSALLEPDCDKDGFGDETQDGNLPTPPCPTSLTCKGEGATHVGTKGNDQIVGTAARDVIAALDGNDRVSGLGGGDVICGGAGKDKLNGGAGKDTLLGQAGKDKLSGGGAKDICKGGKADDSAKGCEVEKSI